MMQLHTKLRFKLQLGFTLVEMVVAVAILGILAAVAIPSLNDAMLGGNLRSYATNLVASINLARGEAIKRNNVTELCVSSDGASCSTGGWEQGWIVKSGTTVIFSQAATKVGFKVTESAGITSLSFQPTGLGSTQAMFTICRAEPEPGNFERVVTVSATGKPSITKTAVGDCE